MTPWLMLSVLCAFCFKDSFCFKLCSSFVHEALPLCSILCSLFPGLSWNVDILKRYFKGVFEAFLLATLSLKVSLENFHWQSFIRHSSILAVQALIQYVRVASFSFFKTSLSGILSCHLSGNSWKWLSLLA